MAIRMIYACIGRSRR